MRAQSTAPGSGFPGRGNRQGFPGAESGSSTLPPQNHAQPKTARSKRVRYCIACGIKTLTVVCGNCRSTARRHLQHIIRPGHPCPCGAST